jgi:hypothetical protein
MVIKCNTSVLFYFSNKYNNILYSIFSIIIKHIKKVNIIYRKMLVFLKVMIINS